MSEFKVALANTDLQGSFPKTDVMDSINQVLASEALSFSIPCEGIELPVEAEYSAHKILDKVREQMGADLTTLAVSQETDFAKAADYALKVASITGNSAKLVFNGVEIVVKPGLEPEIIEDKYLRACGIEEVGEVYSMDSSSMGHRTNVDYNLHAIQSLTGKSVHTDWDGSFMSAITGSKPGW